MEFGQVHHIEYYVNDLGKAKEFWGWFMPELGYKLYNEFKDGIDWIHANGTYIVFVQVKPEYLNVRNNRQGNGLNHIAFVGNSKEQVEELEAKLRKKGIKITYKDEEQFCFEDPNDFAVEIYVP